MADSEANKANDAGGWGGRQISHTENQPVLWFFNKWSVFITNIHLEELVVGHDSHHHRLHQIMIQLKAEMRKTACVQVRGQEAVGRFIYWKHKLTVLNLSVALRVLSRVRDTVSTLSSRPSTLSSSTV